MAQRIDGTWRVLVVVTAIGVSSLLARGAVPSTAPSTRPATRPVFESDLRELVSSPYAAEGQGPSTKPAKVAAAPRLAVPQADALKPARQQVRDILRKEFKIDPMARVALANRFLADADAAGDPALRYVLLQEARDLAASVGEVHGAWEASGRICAAFKVDPAEEAMAALIACMKQAKTPRANSALAEVTSYLLEQAWVNGELAAALKLAPLAAEAAQRIDADNLAEKVRLLTADVAWRNANAERLAQARQTLAQNANDQSANTAVAWDLWLEKQDAGRAIAALAKGSDRDLREVARRDLASPKDSFVQEQVAAAWWDAAQDRPVTVQLRLQERAAHWYRQAIPKLQGEGKTLAERRVASAGDVIPEVSFARYPAPAEPEAIAQGRQALLQAQAQGKAMGNTQIDQATTYDATDKPYVLNGTLSVKQGEHPVEITIGAGVDWRGGTVTLGQRGKLLIKGTKEKPVVLRNVSIDQDLGGLVEAEYVLFDQCTFAKGGAFFAYQSSKWTFKNCTLYRCTFPKLTGVDYGFDLRDCWFVNMTFPEIAHNRQGAFDHMKRLRKDWNRIENCGFVGCRVAPTVFWCAAKSNFFDCKFVQGEAYESDEALDVDNYVAGASDSSDATGNPRAAWTPTPAPRKPVRFTPPGKPFVLKPMTGEGALPEVAMVTRPVVRQK